MWLCAAKWLRERRWATRASSKSRRYCLNTSCSSTVGAQLQTIVFKRKCQKHPETTWLSMKALGNQLCLSFLFRRKVISFPMFPMCVSNKYGTPGTPQKTYKTNTKIPAYDMLLEAVWQCLFGVPWWIMSGPRLQACVGRVSPQQSHKVKLVWRPTNL